MSPELATALESWRKLTSYPDPQNWVFASPQALGRKPFWPDAVLKRHVLPAAERAGITKGIGYVVGLEYTGSAVRVAQPRKGRRMKFTRTRYQQGSLTIEKRKTVGEVWVYRWREAGPNGRMTRRKQIVGTKSQYRSKSAAMRAVEGLQLDINTESISDASRSLTVNELIEHYRLLELTDGSSKTARTKQVYEHQLANIISPKWGGHCLRDVKPIAVEKWLNSLPVAPGTRYKTKGVLSVLYQHAMRYEWATTNPIRLVRQSALPLQEEITLTPVEVGALLSASSYEIHSAYSFY